MTSTTNMVFSESSNKTGMFELFQDYTFTNSTSYTAYKYARDANNALADYLMLALSASGQWQVDDSNQSAVAEISRDLISGTYQYGMTVDDATSANQVLEIERVECATDATGTLFQVLEPYDEMEGEQSIVYNRTISGIPYRYSKRNNAIFLDPTPNYNCRLANEGKAGLRVFVSRTTTYFAGTDTTKVAGIPHAHQKYLVLKPAYTYCAINLPQRAPGLLLLLQEATRDIKDYYARRDKDEHRTITMEQPNFM